MSVKNVFSSASEILDQGWMSRGFLVGQFWLAFHMTDWAMAFASTSLAVANRPDLLGVAATIGAVAAVPQALLMLATNKYIEFRARDSAGNQKSN
jgi:hypothetical protein